MKMLSIAVAILISTAGMVESPTSINEVRELISAPSFVPEEELYTHIAGGYFSSFDMKIGQFWNPNSIKNVKRSIRIELSDLYYDSRFVYLPEGELILSKGSKDEEVYSLKKLDYVQIEGSDIPAYRLSAVNSENNTIATLISTSVGTEIPKMIGTLYVESNNKIKSYDIKINGRNNIDQENHLCKKIESVSHFSEESTKLTFGDNATDVEKVVAQNAYEDVISVYKDMGFDFSDIENPLVYFGTPASWEENVLENTIALYNSDEKYVLMTPFESESFQENLILGTRGNEDVFYSILFHEFCHHLNNVINSQIAPNHDEFIASALQLATLPEALLNQVVNEYGSLRFESRNDISLLAYISTPKPFQVASYVYASSHKGQVPLIIQNSQYLNRDPFLVARL